MAYHKSIEGELNQRQNFFMKSTPKQAVARRFFLTMTSTALVEKPESAERLIDSSLFLRMLKVNTANGLDT